MNKISLLYGIDFGNYNIKILSYNKINNKIEILYNFMYISKYLNIVIILHLIIIHFLLVMIL